MTMPLQLGFSVDRESVAMGDDVISDKHVISVDAGTSLSVMMHRYASRDVKGPSAC
ncbi:hypothetical protein M2428_003360 [Arthrobacter sp. ES3-54]|nr:hypothetical protein [Arthrobacter sp. ES3-54]